MSLDQNLFTLFLVPNTAFPAGTVVDLTDTAGTVHYRKRRILQPQLLYRIDMTDPLSEALLASATSPSATSKHKTLALYNPAHVVELKYTGTLSFRWAFTWETHEFEWKREECFIIRKPDPPVLVAVTKEPPGRIRTASVQILDYNLHRFDIEDRKGLEIVILTALLTFQDASDAYHDPNTTASSSTPNSPPSSAMATPTPPPKPPAKKGVARIAELQLGRGHVNEVTVFDEGSVSDYAKHCTQLLQDDAMLFISVCSSEKRQVHKVLQVAEETKRLRHKAGDQDLHQYAVYDTKEGTTPSKGPRIINLDDTKGKDKMMKEYTPPTSLTIHLSKIDMPELLPRGRSPQATRHDQDSRKQKEPSKRGKDKDKAKDKDKNTDRQGSRPKRPSLPETHSTPPHPTMLRKYRTQYFHPTAPAGASHQVPPLPPRMPATGTRQSMYGTLSGDLSSYPYQGVTHPGSGATPTSGLLGRFLGR